MQEHRYQFRQRLNRVHQPDRRNPLATPSKSEILIENDWRIVVSHSAPPVIWNAARDLQDYLLVSMGVSTSLVRVRRLSATCKNETPTIIFATKDDLPEMGRKLSTPRGYRLQCAPKRIIVCGHDARGTAQGSYYLEDLMNLCEAPILKTQDLVRQPVFSPRMTHSGWGLDQFPDAYLNDMTHHGFDAILLFVRGVDHTTQGYLDFNDLIDRAAGFGLDVYFYSCLKSSKHPGDPGAEAYYGSTYGELFRACPRAKGVVLVGESVEFPSHDQRTTGRPHDAPLENGLPPTKPSPGWWPCRDYPQWVKMVKKVVRKHNRNADIVFWTYNWGWAPRVDRLALLRALPTDITLLVTFEMFDQVRHGNVTHVCVDYTASFAGPGQYFKSEAEVAHHRKIRLYAMSNTGGMTWDFGVIPYEPVPFQWARRYTALLESHRKWGLSGLMESHHYGWWPSFVSELAKWAYWKPSPSIPEMAAAIARRDYGADAAPGVIQTWKAWSEAIRHYIPTNEDQYGPFRIGPSYPLVFHPSLSTSKDLKVPEAWHAWHGNRVVFSTYRPMESEHQSPGPARVQVEIRSLRKMSALWQKGLRSLENALKRMPSAKRPNGGQLLNLGRFMLNMMTTVIHVKQWWLLNQQLLTAKGRYRSQSLLDMMVAVARHEIRNAAATIPLVEKDSRLGWEPSMEYMTDAEHLRWKIAQVKIVLSAEIPQYRKAIVCGRSKFRPSDSRQKSGQNVAVR